jgi:hypothetical protein
MPIVKPPKFARPELLNELKPSSLRALLHPFRGYFEERGTVIPPHPLTPSDREAVAHVLLSLDERTPLELIETLELLDLLSDPQSVFNFEERADSLVQTLREPDDAPADIALKIIHHAPHVAWQVFDRRALAMARSMTSYLAASPLAEPTTGRLASLESAMAPWFESHGRSDVCSVRAHRQPDGWAFVVRHGDPITRIGIIAEGGQSTSALLRPERLDIAFYCESTGEWRISGIGTKLQRLYQQALGEALHGQSFALKRSSRYTLEPLRAGRDALADHEVPYVRAAVLKQLTFRAGACPVTLGPGDVFTALHGMCIPLSDVTEFHEATFALKLSHRRALVHVRVRPGSDSICGTAGLPAVDQWLEQTGFAAPQHDSNLLASN